MPVSVRNHFKIHRVGVLYASLAAELSDIRGYSTHLHANSGDLGVREHLSSMASSYRGTRLNTWQGAAFSAMAESDWLCGGGFDLEG
jgi:hypothetical protein